MAGFPVIEVSKDAKEEDVELNLGLSIGGSSKKPERAVEPLNGFKGMKAQWSVELPLFPTNGPDLSDPKYHPRHRKEARWQHDLRRCIVRRQARSLPQAAHPPPASTSSSEKRAVVPHPSIAPEHGKKMKIETLKSIPASSQNPNPTQPVPMVQMHMPTYQPMPFVPYAIPYVMPYWPALPMVQPLPIDLNQSEANLSEAVPHQPQKSPPKGGSSGSVDHRGKSVIISSENYDHSVPDLNGSSCSASNNIDPTSSLISKPNAVPVNKPTPTSESLQKILDLKDDTEMPYVVTTGDDGRRITGLLYNFKKGEVRIMCICHGNTFTPKGFVQHAGGSDTQNPLKHIVIIHQT